MSLLFVACGRGSKGEGQRALSSFGVAMQPYALSGYELVDEDVVEGTGGTWVSLRYVAAQGSTPDRGDVRKRIADALEKDGWSPEPLPPRAYVMSKMWETGKDDVYFSHGPGARDPAHVFYHQAVHISADGRIIACYYEAGR